MMALIEFERLLKQAMGLSAATIGEVTLERALQERQQACGLPDLQAYWDRLQSSTAELQELIEALVVPETWFFRHGEAFSALVEVARKGTLRTVPGTPLRLLSLPCATGEEPYSMAMALLDAGFSAGQFHIDAVDISQRALGKARAACYGKHSFRSRDLGFRERYFEATGHGYRLIEPVRRLVQFRQGNLFSPLSFPQAASYELIFCRNLLIYFDRPTQEQAIAVLGQLLAPHGLLFVGHAETSLLTSQGFVPAQLSRAFAFHKAERTEQPPWPAPARTTRAAPAKPLLPPPPRQAAASRPASPPPSRPVPSPGLPRQAETELDAASRLADQGQFAAAARLCLAHLDTHGPSARVFHLLGLVNDASGDAAEAASFYRKALYLDPEHGEALIHLALLLEKQGHMDSAQRLHARARRLKSRTGG
ncbi:protein-glutamate O-methyltransferase CheR [Pseudogulbenkiania sp. MAI-1]|uniref:CheR family methyltransferase n=1 Tax=Pseudogulbenkiania sp. MAI-1 TaxID=990370 RepID=UPI0004ACF348|nr:protein-glutamate O-methyltransferase CheR [Pseudogulbenkiania sp. MAI-1]